MSANPPYGFVELEELVQRDDSREEWEETARWVTLEETVESDRWSKPHVPCLSLEGLQNIRDILQQCPLLIDLEQSDMTSIVDDVVDQMISCGDLEEMHRAAVVRLLLLNHCHKDHQGATTLGQRLNRHFTVNAQSDQDREPSTTSVSVDIDRSLLYSCICISNCKEGNAHPKKQVIPLQCNKNTELDLSSPELPNTSESTTVLVGTVQYLKKPIAAFVRLAHGCYLGNLMEVNVPVRFIFVLFVPEEEQNKCKEIGRSIAAMMTDKSFLSLAYRFKEREVLLEKIDEFLNDCVVIPPGEWDRQILLQTIPVLESQSRKMCERRRRKDKCVLQEDVEMVQGLAEDPLQRTGRFCGGLVRDIKRSLPHYISDFTDAFDIHCLAAIVFVYIASLAPAITFGGILSEKTGGWIGVTETILATAIGGVLFALLAGQPLTIISFTGPLVVFEKNTYVLSESYNIEYLPFRAWIGIWVMVICFVIVAFEGCFLVRYFTRFTEEIFACIIAFTFIYDAINIVVNEYNIDTRVVNTTLVVNGTNVPSSESITLPTSGHLSLLLGIGTFFISYLFRRFRHSHFLDYIIRRIVSDFGVLIAILSMVWYYNTDDNSSVSLLDVPDGFQRTKSDRSGWFVNPMGDEQEISTLSIVGAIVPAILVSILIFMEVELTGVILDKKEFKLKKGTGYNMDLLVVGAVVGLCSILGFPWMCASPIHSVSHVQALMIFSNRQAPGERPELVEVKEQRVTNIIIHILIGISAILAPILRFIPIPVLAGVLLYLGICSLSHIQLCERIKMLFQTAKHHPDVSYVLRVKTKKMHLFTLIQVACVCLIILIKFTPLAPGFPFFVLCLIPLRKIMTYWFNEDELEYLDNEAEELNEDEYDEFDAVHVPI